jgi:hypothetical protein
MPNESHSTRERRVELAIADYYECLERKEPFDRSQFLEKYPDLRIELEAFLNDKAVFDRVAGLLMLLCHIGLRRGTTPSSPSRIRTLLYHHLAPIRLRT